MLHPPALALPAFKYVAGDPSLDLVNTVDWTREGPVNDRLTDYERLTRWAEGAGVLFRAAAERLRRQAARHPGAAGGVLDQARALRTLLHRLFTGVAERRRTSPELEQLNELLADAHAHRRLRPSPARAGGAAAEWSWDDADNLASPLWPVVRSAAELLASDEAAAIHTCGGEDCGWMYVDRSRNGLRRWCEMETCGTRAKTRKRRAERWRNGGTAERRNAGR